MGNPRWPPRNHEKLQMLVSLQPTKIKKHVWYVLLYEYFTYVHIWCSSIYAKSIMGLRNTNKKSYYMLWNTMNARPPLFYQILMSENNIKCKMAATHWWKWNYDCYATSTMMTLLQLVPFMFGHWQSNITTSAHTLYAQRTKQNYNYISYSKQTVNFHIMCSGNINEITKWMFIVFLALHSCLHAFMSLCIYLNFMVFLICFRPCIFIHFGIRW